MKSCQGRASMSWELLWIQKFDEKSCHENNNITSKSVPPKAIQKQSGPAKSVSCMMDMSADFKGFNTARVWKYIKHIT